MKKPGWAQYIRKLLREEIDGLTISEICQLLDASTDSIHYAIKQMPDAYIDRWTRPSKYRQTESIWCVVVPPENCPKPEGKNEI